MENQNGQLLALADYLNSRREAILANWRRAAEVDPIQTTVRSLSKAQFYDHIPPVLDGFETRLRAKPDDPTSREADRAKKTEEVKHGLHRWQQGYRLLELMHEWGHLQLCLFEEMEAFAAASSGFSRKALAEANRQMISMVNDAISESTGQYERMQRAEAAGRLGDLEVTLAGLRELDRRRTTLIHQAVHDLRTNVQSVSSAANVLSEAGIAENERVEFAELLQQGVQSVSEMLGELMELARLEAGRDRRQISAFEVAPLLAELCDVSRPIAMEHRLSLDVLPSPSLHVDGDARKVRRIAQNLVLNALKYTTIGGVTVSWGEEGKNWWLMVSDTGPGLMGGPGAPMLKGLEEATASARESDEIAATAEGDVSHVLKPDLEGSEKKLRSHQHPGEGIGLSIVKRLCELLDASLELASSTEKGTTFRVVFPREYPPAER
jgi:signal transduction histidine kinase